MPAGEDAPDSQHDRTMGRLSAASSESFRYDGDEDLAGTHSDDEGEETRNSLSLSSRIASALVAGGEWLERGSGPSPTNSSRSGRTKASGLRDRGSSNGNTSPVLGRASPLSSPLSTLRSGTTMEV